MRGSTDELLARFVSRNETELLIACGYAGNFRRDRLLETGGLRLRFHIGVFDTLCA